MTRQQQRTMEAFQHRSYFGLGANPTGQETQQGAASTVGSSLLSSAGLATAVGGPVAGGIVAAAGAIANIVSLFGPNPNNTYTTEVVNQVAADALTPNLEAWQALPDSEKTPQNQQAAEIVFTQGWNYVLNACSNPALGSAGINCLKDRQRGGKYDWWALYYDPIANDPAVAANVAAAQAAAASTGSMTTPTGSTSIVGSGAPLGTSISNALGGISPLAIGAALIGLALIAGSD